MTVKRIPFAIASDEAVSLAFSRQRLLNLYAEVAQTRAKSSVLILGRPGLRPFGTIPEGPVRGSLTMNGLLYEVAGDRCYSVDATGAVTAIGTVLGGDSVVMATNGTQLGIATGSAWVDEIDGFMLWGRNGIGGAAYLYNRLTGDFGEITDPDLFLDGTGKFQISELNDASSYDGLDFATAEQSPDGLIRGFVNRAEIFLFGSDSIEIWYVSGNADFPMERQNQNVVPKGIMGRECVAAIDNSIIWIGRDPDAGGTPIVYRLNGYEAFRISTHAVEAALARVADWSTVKCLPYIINGHAFFHIVLPEGASLVYDCASKLWHEQETEGLGRWLGNTHSDAYGKQIVGSCVDGQLFTLDPDYDFDGTQYIAAEMISVPLGDDGEWKTLANLQFDLEAGRGLATGQGSDPKMMVQLSYDRGRNWGNEKWVSLGLAGDYGLRVRTGPHGRFRSVMVKVRITDPIQRRFMDYFADIL